MSYDDLLKCPGWKESNIYNILDEMCCGNCRFSWWAHRKEGIECPPKCPPLKGLDNE